MLDHADELVLKPANESGGYGLTIGNRATPEELEAAKEAILADPRNWVAQPILAALDRRRRCATGSSRARHLDLRPFILSGESTYVTKGGLTRVALREGSLVVNSSQGGGSKDTWIVELDPTRERAALPGRRGPLLGGAHTSSGPRTRPGSCGSTANLIVDLPTSVMSAWEPLLAVTGFEPGRRRRGRRSTRSSSCSSPSADNPSSIVDCVRAGPRQPAQLPRGDPDRRLVRRQRPPPLRRVERRGRSRPPQPDPVPRPGDRRTPATRRHPRRRHDPRRRLLDAAPRTSRRAGRHDHPGARRPSRSADGRASRARPKAYDDVQWTSVLRSLSALQMFHRTPRQPVSGPATVASPCTRPRFPRSVAYCLQRRARRDPLAALRRGRRAGRPTRRSTRSPRSIPEAASADRAPRHGRRAAAMHRRAPRTARRVPTSAGRLRQADPMAGEVLPAVSTRGGPFRRAVRPVRRAAARVARPGPRTAATESRPSWPGCQAMGERLLEAEGRRATCYHEEGGQRLAARPGPAW